MGLEKSGYQYTDSSTFYSSHVLFPPPVKRFLTHGVNNEVQLPIIDCDIDIGCQELINNIDDRFHEVLSHVLKDLFGLTWLEPERQILSDEGGILKLGQKYGLKALKWSSQLHKKQS